MVLFSAVKDSLIVFELMLVEDICRPLNRLSIS